MDKYFKDKVLICVTIGVICIFTSCGLPYCIKLPFTEEELKWTEPYSVNDTILFIGAEKELMDTLIVIDKNLYNPSSSSIFDLRGCMWWNGNNEYSAVARTDLAIIHNQIKYVGGFTIHKVCNKKPIMISTYFMKRLVDSFYIQEIKDNKPVNFVEIEDLIIRDSDFTERIASDSIALREIYWNRDKGLTGYKIGDEVYVLKEDSESKR